MKRPAKISHPTLKSATRLTPLQLNTFRFDVKHTLLTPENLERMAGGED